MHSDDDGDVSAITGNVVVKADITKYVSPSKRQAKKARFVRMCERIEIAEIET